MSEQLNNDSLNQVSQPDRKPGFNLSADSSSLTVGSQVNVGLVKPVDSKTLTGSYPGDHRENESQDFSTDQFKNQAGPRGETGTKGA
jgi:hypothetical protein